MDSTNLSAADIAALQNNGMNLGENSLIWFFLILIVLGWNRGGGASAPAPAPGPAPNYVTQSEFQAGLNNQSVQNGLNQISRDTLQGAYQTAQQISDQTSALSQMYNTTTINGIQGFNEISRQLADQTGALSSKLDQLGFTVQQCCCDMKTTMLNGRLEDSNRRLIETQNELSNAQQNQQLISTLLGNAGRFVAWAGEGAATAGVVNTAS